MNEKKKAVSEDMGALRFGYPLQINFNLCFIAGMGRVGKTLLGTILSACDNVEYSEEPWGISFIPKLSTEGGVNDQLIDSLFETYIKWLFDEVYMMRGVNFRPDDLSYIGRKKSKDEIVYRFNNVKNLFDVEKKSKNSTFILNISENCNDFSFYKRVLQSFKIIYVIRNAMDVAIDVFNKQWFFTKRLAAPCHPTLYRKYNKYYLPFWVTKSECDYFLSLTEFERGLYYFAVMSEMSLSCLDLGDKRVCVVKYEDLVDQPSEVFNHVAEFLGVSRTARSDELLRGVKKCKSYRTMYNVRADLRDRVNRCLNKFDFEAQI